MALPKYALCKHGPNCRRRAEGICGFAHSLDELCMPSGLLPQRRWVDESHTSGGRAGIDYFLGQAYTIQQHERVLLYVAHAVALPQWVQMYLWFIGHPKYVLQSSAYFSWYSDVSLLNGCMCRQHFIPSGGVDEVLSEWKPPFRYALDVRGSSFDDRMERRFADGTFYRMYRAREAFSEEQCMPYRQEYTSMHWGPDSRRYFSFSVGDMFVGIGVSTGVLGGGWLWVVRPTLGSVGGWVSPLLLDSTDDYVFSEDMPSGILMAQDTEVEYVPPSASGEYTRIAPDGTDLTSYTQLVICHSDGSVDEPVGFGVGALCMFPLDVEEWTPASVSVKAYCSGSCGSELVGIILNLGELHRRIDDFGAAVVYCDNTHVVRYVGDHARMYSAPASREGWKLYPLILYARNLMLKLRVPGKQVFLKHLPRKYNLADRIAYSAMVSRRDARWSGMELNADRLDGMKGLRQCIDAVSKFTRDLKMGVFQERHARDFLIADEV